MSVNNSKYHEIDVIMINYNNAIIIMIFCIENISINR